MNETRSPHFLLVGNGPYANRGCEAIVRGTMEILRREFGPDVQTTVASFQHKSLVDRQAADETDPAITHVALRRSLDRWSGRWLHYQWLRISHPFTDLTHSMLNPHLPSASAVLQVGGDNYTLDYGWPAVHLSLDRYVWRGGLPVILWGASVGPFDAVPLERRQSMFKHLSRMRAIIVRETISQRYLNRNSMSNVHLAADPAFLMKPRKLSTGLFDVSASDAPIGLNFSPLMAGHVTGGDRLDWIRICASIVEKLLMLAERKILLIPHVTSNDPMNDDAVLHKEVLERLGALHERVVCVSGTLSAAEYKWVISQCHVFAGARTHATIAAFSTGVPTLSLAYSAKAIGLNEDLFGTQEYCLGAAEMANPENVVNRMKQIMAAAEGIRNRLSRVMPGVIDRAFLAGRILGRIVDDPNTD